MPVVVLCVSEPRPGTDPFVQLKGTLEALDGSVVATVSGRKDRLTTHPSSKGIAEKRPALRASNSM